MTSAAMGADEQSPADLLTVIVLTYQQRTTIDRTLDSVLDQRSDFPFRILVHDDASTDGTQERLRKIAALNPGRIDLLLRQENQFSQGICIPAQLLLDVRSRYVAFLEGDDHWTDPDKLALQVQFMEERPWCTVSHHEFTLFNDGGRDDYEAHLRRYLAGLPWRTMERAPGNRLALGNFVRTCTAMIRRDAIRDEVLRAAFDVRPGDHLIFGAATENGDIGFIDRDMATYRLHGENSWAALDGRDRVMRQVGVFWFLSAHLRGPAQLAWQQGLFHYVMKKPVLRGRYPALLKLMQTAQAHKELTEVTAEVIRQTEELLAAKAATEAQLAQVTSDRDQLYAALSSLPGLSGV